MSHVSAKKLIAAHEVTILGAKIIEANRDPDRNVGSMHLPGLHRERARNEMTRNDTYAITSPRGVLLFSWRAV